MIFNTQHAIWGATKCAQYTQESTQQKRYVCQWQALVDDTEHKFHKHWYWLWWLSIVCMIWLWRLTIRSSSVCQPNIFWTHNKTIYKYMKRFKFIKKMNEFSEYTCIAAIHWFRQPRSKTNNSWTRMLRFLVTNICHVHGCLNIPFSNETRMFVILFWLFKQRKQSKF